MYRYKNGAATFYGTVKGKKNFSRQPLLVLVLIIRRGNERGYNKMKLIQKKKM